MEIFHLTKSFPKEEMYSLTDQIRRSSRSVTSSLTEGYKKRIYPKSYAFKLADADAENTETQICLEYSLACEYIRDNDYNKLNNKSIEVGKLLNYMILNLDKFGVKIDN